MIKAALDENHLKSILNHCAVKMVNLPVGLWEGTAEISLN